MSLSLNCSDTRLKILRTAEKLFAEMGYEFTSTRRIATSAGLNLSLISYYFGSKQALYTEIFCIRLEEGKVSLERPSCLPIGAIEKWNRFLKIFTDRYRLNSDFQRMLYREMLFPLNPAICEEINLFLEDHISILKGIMDEGTSVGVFNTLDCSLFFMTMVNSMYMAINKATVWTEFTALHQAVKDVKKYLHQVLLKNPMAATI